LAPRPAHDDAGIGVATKQADMDSEIRAIPVRHVGRWIGAIVAILFVGLVARLFILSPNIKWGKVAHYLLNDQILVGLRLTIIFTIAAMAIGISLGIVIAVMRLSVNPVLRIIGWFYIWIFRGTPMLVQIIFWFNIALILPRIGIGIPYTHWWWSTSTNTIFSASVAAVVALGLNETAYMSEIVRAGIQVVDYGQTEAGLAVGMKRGLVFRLIVLPQAMRAIIPPTGNDIIGMLKSTSLVSVIAAQELLTKAQNIYAGNFLTVELLLVAAFWYLVVTTVLTWGQYYVERHFARGATNREPPPTPLQRLRSQMSRLLSVRGTTR
jgi:polar amino acid transport system permease protein